MADAIKDRIVQPRRQLLHPLPRRLRAISAGSARLNPHKQRRPHKLRRRHHRPRADNGSNGPSVHRNRCKLRRLRLLLHPLRHRHRRLRAISASSARLNPHKLRRLHKLRRRHRRLRADNGSNGLSAHRERRKLRRLLLLLRLQRCRLPLHQRLRQNRPIPITAKKRTATGKTIGPLRPDPVHGIGLQTGKFRPCDCPWDRRDAPCARRRPV